MKKRNLSELLEELLTKYHFLMAPEIVSLLEESGNSFNKTSVYRRLDQMLADKQVCRHSFGTDKVYYELRTEDSAHHHDHFVCERCHAVEHIACVVNTAPIAKQRHITHHHSTVFGYCEDCVPYETSSTNS